MLRGVFLVFLCSFMLAGCAKNLVKENISNINLNQHGYIAGRFYDTMPAYLKLGNFDLYMTIKNSSTGDLYNINFSDDREINIIEVPIGEYKIVSIIRNMKNNNQLHQLPDELLYPLIVKNGEITYIGSLETKSRLFQSSLIIYLNDYENAKNEIIDKNQSIDPISIIEYN